MSITYIPPYLDPNQQVFYDMAISSFPDTMQTDTDIQMLCALLATICGLIKDMVDSFPSLIDADTCPSQFLPYLSTLVGYPYDNTLSADSQRVSIKNYMQIQTIRGSILSLKLAAIYGAQGSSVSYNPAIGDVSVTPYSGSYTTPDGRVLTGKGVYIIRVPQQGPLDNAPILNANPAGFYPVIYRFIEQTIVISAFDVNAIEINPLYFYPIQYLINNSYTNLQIDSNINNLAVSSNISVLRPSGESVLVCGTSAVSQGQFILGEY